MTSSQRVALASDLGEEEIVPPLARSRARAEIDVAFQVPDDHHAPVLVVDGDGDARLVAGASEALAPDRDAARGELGHEDVGAVRALERSGAEIDAAREIAGDVDVSLRVDGERLRLLDLR